MSQNPAPAVSLDANALAALPPSVVAANPDLAALIASQTPPAPQRTDPTPAVWAQAIGTTLAQVAATGASFTAHTVVIYARAANPTLNIPGFKSRELVRAVLLADSQVGDPMIELVRDLVITNLPADVQTAIKRGNLSVGPTTVKGHATDLYTFLAALPAGY